jgi:hypothetical protein
MSCSAGIMKSVAMFFSVTSHAPYIAVILYCWSDKFIMTLEYLDRNAGLKVEFIVPSILMLMAIVMLTSRLVLFHRMDYILKI